jgi:hypothetical protein
MPNMKIKFSVSGVVEQEVKMIDPLISRSALQQLLNTGKVVTTIQEGGTVEFLKDGEVIGKVVSVDNECSYEDFEVKEVI